MHMMHVRVQEKECAPFGHRMPVLGRFAGCHRTSGADSGPVRRTSSAGSLDAAGRRFPTVLITVGCRFAGCRATDCRRYAAQRRMPTVNSRKYRSPSDAGPPVATGTDHRRMPSQSGCFVPPVRFWFVKTFTCG